MGDEVEGTIESTNEENSPDPRVQIELERLNHAGESINSLELQLDEARKNLQVFIDESEDELTELEKRIGSAVSKARTYYDARLKIRDVKETLTKARHRFERAQSLHVAAKEIAAASAEYIDEAEQLHENATAWSQTYRDALVQAGNAERDKILADLEQQKAEKLYSELELLIAKLEKDYRKSINKSKPYYEMRAACNKEVDFQKRKIFGLENCVQEAKGQYQQSLRSLERISIEIHEQRSRQNSLSKRCGNGEEQRIPVCESIQSPDSKPPSTSPATATAPEPHSTSHSNDILRSCLLRTETLPTGIFTNTPDRSSPVNAEENGNDQFVLRPNSPPHATILVNSDSTPSRSTSVSSHVTGDDDDEEDRTGSLHVLSDEQIHHLATMYDDDPAEKGTHPACLQGLSPNLLYSLSNPLSKLVLNDNL